MARFDLIFEGGGAKGMVFVGALKAFRKAEHEFRRLIGTSAGAITAVFLAAGFDPDEMADLMSETTADGEPRFATFMDTPAAFSDNTIHNSLIFDIFNEIDVPFVPQWLEDGVDRKIFARLERQDRFRRLFSFIERGGLYEGRAFRDWLTEKLGDRNPDFATATLFQFHEMRGVDLSMVVSDTTDQEMRVLNHRTAPDLPVVEAVRMTMSIPFVWQEVIWKEEWGTYLDQSLTGNVFVDGGLLSNFPLELIIESTPENIAVMGDTDPTAAGTIGLLIDETIEVPNAPPAVKEENHSLNELRVLQRLRRLADTTTSAHDHRVMDSHQKLVCRLPAKDYGTTEFGMTKERRDALVQAGFDSMKNYLAQL